MTVLEHRLNGTVFGTRNDGATRLFVAQNQTIRDAAIAAWLALGPSDTPPTSRKTGALVALLLAKGTISDAEALTLNQTDD